MPEQAPTLVLGAAGFFGLAIVRALSAAGMPVIACDRVAPEEFLPRPGSRGELVRYERRELTTEPLDDLVAEAGGAIHAAALTPANEAAGDTAEQLLRVNLESLLVLLRLTRVSRNCRRVLFVSSAGVFDQQQVRTLREADADGGTSLYGAAKLAGELVGRRFASVTGVDFGAVRPTSLYGAGERVRESRPRVTAFAQLVAAARQGEPVRIVNSQARCDWLCVDDAAEAVTLLWQAERLGGVVYNLSSGRPRPFGEVATEVAAGTGLELSEQAATSVDGGHDRPAQIENSLICETFGWRPRRTLAEEARALVREPVAQGSASA